MTVFADFYDYVMPYVRGADSSLIDLSIRRVLRQFMGRSTLVRENIPITLVAGQASYVLSPITPSTSVGGLLRASINRDYGASVSTFSALGVVGEADVPRNAQEATAPTGVRYTLPGMLTFYPTPDAAYPVYAHVYLKFSLDPAQTTIPPEVEDYIDSIALGVIGELMLMPGKPWSSERLALLYGGRYAGFVNSLRDRIRRGGPNEHYRAKSPIRFGA